MTYKGIARNKIFSLILLIALFIGLSLLFYPSLSQYWNSKIQSKATIDYEKIVSKYTDEEIENLWKNAEKYNGKLNKLNYSFSDCVNIHNEYMHTLNADGKGMIGYLVVDKLGLNLPIYHTVDEEILNNFCGHMEGSSLPVLSDGVHTVLSAHRGLPNSTLFTHLDKMELGDIFYINILNTTLTYQVDQIKTVEPNDLSDVQVEEGENYCTLLTCTPYGINTHRLLVRGRLIESDSDRILVLSPNAYLIDRLIVVPFIALPIIFILIVYIIVKPSKKKFRPEEYLND